MRLGDKFILIVGAIVIILLLVSCGSLHPDQRYSKDWTEKNIYDAFVKQGIIK